jgi:hypothetical protein
MGERRKTTPRGALSCLMCFSFASQIIMPRPNTKLTIEQINEILQRLEFNQGDETNQALKAFLEAELKRRIATGILGGRPVTVADKKAANREYQRKHRAKKKSIALKSKIS